MSAGGRIRRDVTLEHMQQQKDLHMSTPGFRSLRLAVTALSAAALLGACTLISDYDERTDEGVNELQTEVATHLAVLEQLAAGPNGKPVSPECKFANFQDTYAQLIAHAHVLTVRNEARAKNELTTQQLTLLTKSLGDGLVAVHRDADGQCMSEGAIIIAQQILDQNFRAILKLELAKKEYRAEK
jgi:hypothetical protein